MKIQLLVAMASDTLAWRPGDLIEVDAAEGKRLVDAEYAIAVSAEAEIESGEAKTKRSKERR
jgi:hypothetical protein